MQVRIEERPPRRCAVAHHDGGEKDVDRTRRPLYQHLILHEMVGGPSMLRFRDDSLDVLVPIPHGFQEETPIPTEKVPGGRYAVMEYEGPMDGLPAARTALRSWLAENGHTAVDEVLQVHLMDEVDGETEQRLEVRLAS